MVIEDLVTALVAVIAALLLVAGLAQALQLYPRRRVRRGRGPVGVRPPIRQVRDAQSSPRRPPEASPTHVDPAAVEVPVFLEGAQALGAEPETAPAPAPEASRDRGPERLPLEECVALFETRQYEELLMLAEPSLRRLGTAGPARRAGRAHQLAALWSLVGLSRQALNAPEAAKAAFQAAIEAAPESEQPDYRRQLATLAGRVGEELLTRAEAGSVISGEDRVTTLKQATRWLRSGLMAAPGDETLASSLGRAEEGLWIACGQVASALLERQEFHGAQRLIQEALAEENLPPSRREALKDLLAASYAGEVWQLTARAIRGVDAEREPEALTALERAEGLLAEIPEGALTPDRWQEVSRRVRQGYARLGLNRVEAGEFERALEAFLHGLRIGTAEAEGEPEARQAAARALEAVVDSRAALVKQLMRNGKREAALAEVEQLRALVREGMDSGLTRQELARALSKTRQLIDQLAQGWGR